LIALPALLMSGVPPLLALGTNKLQGSVGTATSSFMMLKNKKVLWSDVRYLMLFAFLGSLLGTLFLQLIDTDSLQLIVPFVLSMTLIYFVVTLRIKPSESIATQPKLTKAMYQSIVVPIIGFYDGLFGPGTGSFFTLAGMSLRSQELLRSTAIAKTLNFATNISSLLVFIALGKVVWAAGFIMMLGQLLGAFIGARVLFDINQLLLRVIVIVMCSLMLIKYLMFDL